MHNRAEKFGYHIKLAFITLWWFRTLAKKVRENICWWKFDALSMMQLSFMGTFIINLNLYRVDGTMEVSIEIHLSRPLQIQTLLEKHVRSRKLEIARCGFSEVCKTTLAKMCEIAFGKHWFSIKLWSALVINNSQQILRSLCPRYRCVFIDDTPELIKKNC